ncbi:MAG: Glu/Leu/Phe/Val family dehydrogenase [Acidimicrobiales bacterium]
MFERIGGEGSGEKGYEQVVFCQDAHSGLRAIIAVHSTVLGPALGGTRFHPYEQEDDALEDVLRLARQMTYKSAAAGLDLGGGKAVVLGDPALLRSEALWESYARFVDSLGGRYITAEDVGTTEADMDLIRGWTSHVTGGSVSHGGSGDPSVATAVGVLRAMEAVAVRLWGTASLVGRRVVVSGVGKVGSDLARRLRQAGARISISDVRAGVSVALAAELGADVVHPDKAHATECDIFSPCALGGALSPATIAELRCAAVVGSANNQLTDLSCPALLAEAGVLYAPDYIVNAGGVVNIADELHGYDRERAHAAVDRIFDTTTRVLEAARSQGITTLEAADRLAEERLAAAGPTRLLV